MLIDNVLYELHECPNPTFLLKSELQRVMEEKGKVTRLPYPKKCMKFKGKYYGYVKVKQKEKDEQA